MSDASFAAALEKLAALTPDKARQAERIGHAAMLEAARVPYALVSILCKIVSRGQLLTEDLAAIERIGIELRIDRLPPELPDPTEPDGRHDDGVVILGEITILNTLDSDGGGVRIRISDGLSWWDAIAMLSAASRSIDRIYAEDES